MGRQMDPAPGSDRRDSRRGGRLFHLETDYYGQGAGTSGTQTAPRVNGRGGFGMSQIFIDPLIKLLTTRAGG